MSEINKHPPYGIIWEDKPSDIVTRCKTQTPIFKIIKTKEITSDINKPTNFIINGDNYSTLLVLSTMYKGKVDVIYLDPPYNRGKGDFIYNDKIVDMDDTYKHSKWLSMMNYILLLARELLSDSGVIFCSLDDNEIAQARMLFDNIFKYNRITQATVITNHKGNNDQSGFTGIHEYLLVYAKNKNNIKFNEFPIDEENLSKWKRDEIGLYKLGRGLKAGGIDSPREKRKSLYFPVFVDQFSNIYVTEDDKPPKSLEDNFYNTVYPETNGKELRWYWNKKKFTDDKNDIIVVRTSKNITFHKKQRPTTGDIPSTKLKSVLYKPEYSSVTATQELKDILGVSILGEKMFDYPKSLTFMEDIIFYCGPKNAIVLDLFAGSGTTGHATLDLNKKDGGTRSFILCEIDSHICKDVCYERIKRVMNGYNKSSNDKRVDSLGGNLQYIEIGLEKHIATTFSVQQISRKLEDTIRVKEECFVDVFRENEYVIFSDSNNKYLAIIYDCDNIESLIEHIKIINKKFIIYVTSISGGVREDEFEEVKHLVSLNSIPSSILDIISKNL